MRPHRRFHVSCTPPPKFLPKTALDREGAHVPITPLDVAIKGIVQYSTRAQFLVEQLATRHSREHTLSAVGPDAQVE